MEKMIVRTFSVIAILSILLAQFGLSPATAAENFIVNSTADMVDANPGDGLCETDITGDCTLRAAIQEANALADRLASMPTRAVGLTKKMLYSAADASLADVLETEAVTQEIAIKTHDHHEGVTAFLEKRAPVFKGK